MHPLFAATQGLDLLLVEAYRITNTLHMWTNLISYQTVSRSEEVRLLRNWSRWDRNGANLRIWACCIPATVFILVFAGLFQTSRRQISSSHGGIFFLDQLSCKSQSRSLLILFMFLFPFDIAQKEIISRSRCQKRQKYAACVEHTTFRFLLRLFFSLTLS